MFSIVFQSSTPNFPSILRSWYTQQIQIQNNQKIPCCVSSSKAQQKVIGAALLLDVVWLAHSTQPSLNQSNIINVLHDIIIYAAAYQ